MSPAGTRPGNAGDIYAVKRHKVMFLGDEDVGKTSLLRRLMTQSLLDEEEVEPTVGVDSVEIDIPVESDSVKSVPLQVYDASGNSRYESLLNMYLKDVALAVIVCDVANPTSFDNVRKWMALVRKENDNAKLCIVASKIDVDRRQMTSEDLRALVVDEPPAVVRPSVRYAPVTTDVSIVGECSARTGRGVGKLFNTIALTLAGVRKSLGTLFLLDTPARGMGCCGPPSPPSRKTAINCCLAQPTAVPSNLDTNRK